MSSLTEDHNHNLVLPKELEEKNKLKANGKKRNAKIINSTTVDDMTVLWIPCQQAKGGEEEVYTTPPHSPIHSYITQPSFCHSDTGQTIDTGPTAAIVSHDILSGCLLTNTFGRVMPTTLLQNRSSEDKFHCFNSIGMEGAEMDSSLSEELEIFKEVTCNTSSSNNNIEKDDDSSVVVSQPQTNKLTAESTKEIVSKSSDVNGSRPNGAIITPSEEKNASKKLTTQHKISAHAAPDDASRYIDLYPKKKKRRHSIKRKLSKIHRKISTKLIPPLEESSNDVEKSDLEHKVVEASLKSSPISNSLPANIHEIDGHCDITVETVATSNVASINCEKTSNLTTSYTSASPCQTSPRTKTSSPSSTKVPNNLSSPASLCTISPVPPAASSWETPLSDTEPSTTWIMSPSSSIATPNGSVSNSPRRSVQYRPPNSLILSSQRSKKSRSAKRGRKKKSIVSSPKMHTIKGTVDKVLSPSYRQKNDDIHKYFKDINETERLLADYTCAFVKDILIQGRLYMTEKFICFRANILKWQTHVQIDFRDIANLNKVKTALVFPNAIQILMKEPQRKYTFTSFTARDKAFNVMSTLWENAQEEKEFTAQETRDFIQRNYGDYFSSDDDEIDGAVASSLQNCDKTSRKTQTPVEMNGEKYSLTSSSRQSSQDLELEEDESSSETKDDEEDDGSSGDDSDVSSFFEDDEEEELSKKKKRKPSKSSKSSKESPTIAGPGKHFLEDEMRMSLFRQYPTSAENMWRIVFGEEDECPFWKDTLINKGTTGIEFGRWKDDEKVEGQKVRSLGYTLRLDNAIGPKTSYCAEMQVMYKESVPGLSYGADCIVQNHGIPYADYFQTIMRYSIIRIDDQTCELRITSGLHYRKTPWGLMKNFIEKNVWAGLAQNFEKLENQIMTFIIEDQQKPKQQTEVPNQLKKRPSLATRSRKNVSSPTGKKPKSTKTRKAAIVPTASSDVINNNVPPSTDDKRIYQPSLMHKPQPTVSSDEEPFVKYQTWIRAAVTILLLFYPVSARIAEGIFMLVYTNISMYRRLNALEKSMPLKRDSTDLFDSSNIYRQDAAYIELLERMDNRLHKMEGWLMENKNKNDERWSQLLALCKSSLVNTEESEYRSSREYDDSNGKR